MSRPIEQPPVPEDLPAEVIPEGLLTYEVDLHTEGIPQICEETSELEEVAVVGCHDAEVVVTILCIVTTGPGAEEVHQPHAVGLGDGPHYPAELLERVLLRSDHGGVIASAPYIPGSDTTILGYRQENAPGI